VRRLPRTRWGRAALLAPLVALSAVLLWWRGPEWGSVLDAFEFVQWRWVGVAFALNLASVAVRAAAWHFVVRQALPGILFPFPRVFSGFAVGLLANAVLPGRIGELARVAVLRRRVERGRGYSAALLGSVFAHRLFDLFPALLLVVFVLLTAKVPHWAVTSLVVVAAIGAVLFALALVGARFPHRALDEGASRVRKLVGMARQGLGVLRAPLAAAAALVFQCLGWTFQLLAVWVMMFAFEIDAPLPAAGLVLLLMNVATIFPLWPGNIGLLQAAVALPLVSYGVAYTTGFAYALGLQVLEMSVGVGVGLVFLMREGLSLETLKHIPEPAVHAVPPPPVRDEEPLPAARARMSG
jgi:uncharacterized membrane protein YbhN (UPF0104 family)